VLLVGFSDHAANGVDHSDEITKEQGGEHN
jgi:hypothetical protein